MVAGQGGIAAAIDATMDAVQVENRVGLEPAALARLGAELGQLSRSPEAP